MIGKGPTVREAKRLLKTRRQSAWVEMVQQYGKNFWYQGLLISCDPELVKKLLMEKVHTQKRSRLYTFLGWIPGAKGLIFLEGEQWRQGTQAVMPTFRKTYIDNFPQFIHNTTLAYASRWQDGERLDDLFTSLMELGAAIALHIGCGLQPGDQLTDRLATELMRYKSQTMSPYPRDRLDEFGWDVQTLFRLPWILIDLLKLRWRVHRIYKIIRGMLLEQQSASSGHPNWLRGLQSAGLSQAQIANQINHLYGAFNAIDFSITCAFYELSRHPNWVTILRAEFKEVLGDRPYPTRSDFPLLTHTLNFMQEVFRMYPVTMAVARRTGAEIEVDGEQIPKGTEVMILLYALHHHPDFWENPETFNPQRWATSSSPCIPYAYIPFLDGPRQCIGRHWAELEFVVILHALLRHYELELLNHDARLTTFLIPRFAEALPCIVRKRKTRDSDSETALDVL